MDQKVIRKIFSGAYFSGFISFYIALSSIIWIPIALNELGLDQYSNYVKVSLFFSTGIPGIFLLGYQSTALKFSSDYWEKKSSDLVTIYWYIVKRVLTISAIFCSVLIFLVGPIAQTINLEFQEKQLLYLVILFLLPQFLNIININFINGKGEFKITQRITFLQELLKLASILILLPIYKSYKVIVFAFIGSQIIGLLLTSFYLIKLKREFLILNYNAESIDLKEIKNFQKQLGVQNIISNLYNSSDKVIGSIFLSASNLAILDLVLKLPLIFNRIIFTAISGVIPALGPEEKNLDVYFKEGFRLFCILCIGLSFTIFNSADTIYIFWLGKDYEPLYGTIVRGFSLWIICLPILFPGSFLISKNQSLIYTTTFRAVQALLKIFLLTLIFYFIGVEYTPYVYFMSIIPGVILFIPLKLYGIKPITPISIFFVSFLMLLPMILIGLVFKNLHGLIFSSVYFLIVIVISIKKTFNQAS